ncbi:hypothetical protein BGX33_010544 [Mortierella sp. NVP41]|nr:hypothetical protein BGX33_010544 [Mortierella sp. NVP41]
MTRYHASLIPLCQIEEPPTFYEGMDDHPPVETDNDDNDSSFFLLDDRDRDRDDSAFFPLTKPHQSSKQRQHQQQQQQQLSTGTPDVNNNTTTTANINHHHDHARYSQEFLQSPEQDERELQQQQHFNRLDDLVDNDDHHSSTGSAYPYQQAGKNEAETTTSTNADAAAAAVIKHQRRRERTLDGSGEQIFFYDGPNLLHATLYSDRHKDDTMSEGMAGTSTRASPASAHRRHQDASTFQVTPTAQDKIKIRVQVKICHTEQPCFFSFTLTSGAWSRSMSETLFRKEQHKQQQHLHQQPSSLPSAKARPSILTRGFSADSKSRQDHEQSNSRGLARDGSTTGSSNRRVSAKERFVALVTRSNGVSTPVQNFKDVHGSGTDSSSALLKDGRRGSADDRSPILAQTHHRRQGSPSLGRAGRLDYSSQTVGATSLPTTDTNLGFPYNNSSLLMSSDFTRTAPSANKTNTLRRGSGKPRPFSVATMEKLLPANCQTVTTIGRSPTKQELPRQEKQQHGHGGGGAAAATAATDHQEGPNQTADRHPHSLPSSNQHHRHHQHRHSSVPVQSHSKGAEHGSLRSRMIGSGSYPLLTSFGTPVEASMGCPAPAAADGDGRRRSVAAAAVTVGKGKEVERFHDREQGFKLVKTTYSESEPITDDLTNSDGGGGQPLHLHEHHIHYHYYCQHCPPLSQSNLDEIGESEGIYGSFTSSERSPLQVLRHSEGTIADAARPMRRQGNSGGGGGSETAEFSTSPIDFGRQGFAPIVSSPVEDPATATTTTATSSKKSKRKSLLGTMTMTSSMRRRFFAEHSQDPKQQQQQQLQQQQQQSPFGQRSGNNHNFYYDKGLSHGTQRHQVSPIMTMGMGFVEKSDGPYGASGATLRIKSTRNQRRRVSLAGLTGFMTGGGGGGGGYDAEADEDEQEYLQRQQQLQQFDMQNSQYYDEYDEEFVGGGQSSQQQPAQQQQQQRAKFLSRLKQFLLRPSPFAKSYSNNNNNNNSSSSNSNNTTTTNTTSTMNGASDAEAGDSPAFMNGGTGDVGGQEPSEI